MDRRGLAHTNGPGCRALCPYIISDTCSHVRGSGETRTPSLSAYTQSPGDIVTPAHATNQRQGDAALDACDSSQDAAPVSNCHFPKLSSSLKLHQHPFHLEANATQVQTVIMDEVMSRNYTCKRHRDIPQTRITLAALQRVRSKRFNPNAHL